MIYLRPAARALRRIAARFLLRLQGRVPAPAVVVGAAGPADEEAEGTAVVTGTLEAAVGVVSGLTTEVVEVGAATGADVSTVVGSAAGAEVAAGGAAEETAGAADEGAGAAELGALELLGAALEGLGAGSVSPEEAPEPIWVVMVPLSM